MDGRKWFLLILLTIAVFAGLVGYGDFRKIGTHLAEFPYPFLVAAFALACANFALRFARWAYYLKVLDLHPRASVSVLVFLSGLAMAITPGKAGELYKCYLLRDRAGIPLSASVPVVVMERLTDLVSVVLIAILGLALLPPVVVWVVGGVLILCMLVVIPIVTRLWDDLLSLPVLRRWKDDLETSRDSLRTLVQPNVQFVSIGLGLVAWIGEGLALWLIMYGLNSDVGIFEAIPVYAAATLVGAITTLPGGLVGTEGSMVAMLQQSGAAREIASTGALLVRLATLWFAVIVGLAALLWLNRVGGAVAGSALAVEPEGPDDQLPTRS